MDLRSQLGFYKYYHYNTVNVLIHAVFIPIILYSSLAILSDFKIFNWKGNTWVAVVYSVFYIYLSVPTGLLFSGIFVAMNTAITNGVLTGTKEKWGLFFLGWVCQFIGHFKFEGDKPAVFDNLVQSLVLAPYFILFELLFKLGFYPELYKELDKDVKLMKIRKGQPIEGINK